MEDRRKVVARIVGLVEAAIADVRLYEEFGDPDDERRAQRSISSLEEYLEKFDFELLEEEDGSDG